MLRGGPVVEQGDGGHRHAVLKTQALGHLINSELAELDQTGVQHVDGVALAEQEVVALQVEPSQVEPLLAEVEDAERSFDGGP